MTNGKIYTAAGTGETAYLEDVLATLGKLNQPRKVFADSYYNLYIADSSNDRIRRVDNETQIISEEVGSLNSPEGLYFDETSGDLYISNTGNHQVLKKSASTGSLTVVAGAGTCSTNAAIGPATSISLCSPQGLFYDRIRSKLYIADTENCLVRMVDSQGHLTNFAGTGVCDFNFDNINATNATLNLPTDVFVNTSNGDVYITDRGNNRIRKVDFSTGNISTVAGSGRVGFEGDGFSATYEFTRLDNPRAVTFDSSTGNMYIADAANVRIRMVSAESGNISTIAGTGENSYTVDNIPAIYSFMNSPRGIHLDKSTSRVYIADTFNHRIRMIDENNLMQTIGGTGLADKGNDNIPANSSSIKEPNEAVVHPTNGNIYFTDSGNHRIRVIDKDTLIVTTVIGTGISGYDGDDILAINARINYPVSLVIVPWGDIYFSDHDNHRIRKVSAVDNKITTIAGTGTLGFVDNVPALNAQFKYPSGIYVDVIDAATSNVNIYLADKRNNRIRLINGTSGNITTLCGSGGFSFNSEIFATSINIGNPWWVAYEPLTGNVYFTDTYNNRIRMMNSSQVVTTIAGTGSWGYYGENINPVDATLANPRGLYLDEDDGVIYVADTQNDRIRTIVPPVPTPMPTPIPTFAPTSLTASPTVAFCPAGSHRRSDNLCYECGPGEFNGIVVSLMPTSCKPCPLGTYASGNGSEICELCPSGYMCDNNTKIIPLICPHDTYSVIGSAECSQCVSPYTTNSEGSSDCSAIKLNADGEAFVYFSFLLFLTGLVFLCKLDLTLMYQLLTFNNWIVAVSFIDFIGDFYYILEEKFYNSIMFAMVFLTVSFSLFAMPLTLYYRRIVPKVPIGNMYNYFPGYHFISDQLIFITIDLQGMLAIKNQKIFKPPTSDEINCFTDHELTNR